MSDTSTQAAARVRAMQMVNQERIAQQERWPLENDDGHSPAIWLALFAEHCGKGAQSIWNDDPDAFDQAVVVIGALALACLESRVRQRIRIGELFAPEATDAA